LTGRRLEPISNYGPREITGKYRTPIIVGLTLMKKKMVKRMSAKKKLFGWSRHCPSCGKFLEKHDPMSPWVCECGWKS